MEAGLGEGIRIADLEQTGEWHAAECREWDQIEGDTAGRSAVPTTTVAPEMTRSTQLAVVALVAGLLTSCGGGDGDNEMIEALSSYRDVECTEVVGVVGEPGPFYRVHGAADGFVALPAGEMQLGRRGPDGSGYEDYRFSKFGLNVRSFRQVSLEIVGAPGEAMLDYGGSDSAPVAALTAGPCDIDGDGCVIEPGEHVRVGPCGSDGGEWVVWAGGIWVAEPGCVELVARSDDEEIPVWLAVGASCDGVAAKSVANAAD